MGGSRLPRRRGRQPSRRRAPTYDFPKFSKKLFEIEKILGATPLDPPLNCMKMKNILFRWGQERVPCPPTPQNNSSTMWIRFYVFYSWGKRKVLYGWLEHTYPMYPAGRVPTSDWSANSFIMVIYEKFTSHPLDIKCWLNFFLKKTFS